MAKITCGSLIRRAGGPNLLGTAGCLVQWPGKTDQLLLLTAARVLVGRTAEQFEGVEAVEAVEAVDLPGKPIGCLYAWSDLKGPTTADVALVHVDPALADAGIGPSGAPKGTNLDPKLGDKLTIFADGKAHNLTITSFGDKTIDRVTPDSHASVNYLNQIICDPATEDRCVGAMAMDGSNNIVGMVVGGDGGAFTLVTPIDALLSCTFGGPEGPALEVCTSVPGTAKAPEMVTHPDHAMPTVEPGAAGAEPAWVTVGLKDLGFHETGDNQGIESFIAQAKCGRPGDKWCAIWANAKLEVSGITGRATRLRCHSATTRTSSSSTGRHLAPLWCGTTMSASIWVSHRERYGPSAATRTTKCARSSRRVTPRSVGTGGRNRSRCRKWAPSR
jgi:hypothetical protein